MRTCLLLPLLGAALLAAAGAVSPPYPPPTPILPDREPGCSPGLWMYDGCNTCRCTQDRQIKCTHNVCRDPAPASCQYGRTYVDQCANFCFCDKFGTYQCRPQGTPGGGQCYGAAVTGKPIACDSEAQTEIRVQANTRFYCEGKIVRFEFVEESGSRCTPGTSWKSECNTCSCTNGAVACTLIGCIPNGPPPPRAPRPAPLEFGDVVLPDYEPCPPGFLAAPGMLGVKVCKAAGCTPGVEWDLSSCEKCVCTHAGEPACTRCVRETNDKTVVCGTRQLVSATPSYLLCPADCGQRYIPEQDCLKCLCGVGEEGDVNVGFDEPCPPGYDHRSSGAFFRSCGPIDDLPRGDHEDCSPGAECPERCAFVRRSSETDCVFCQCAGHELVPSSQPCPPPLLDGPARGDYQRLCTPADKRECSGVGSKYEVGCDLCICQEGGVPACTHRECPRPTEPAGCEHGPIYVDECKNLCRCQASGVYACTRRGCPPGATSGRPRACPQSTRELPQLPGLRVFCHEGIIKAQPKGERCVEGSVFMDDENCNQCSCISGGVACTLMACFTVPPPVAERPGQCPWLDPDSPIRCIHYNRECEDDAGCPGGHRCCEVDCGRQCTPACLPACAPGDRCLLQHSYGGPRQTRARCEHRKPLLPLPLP